MCHWRILYHQVINVFYLKGSYSVNNKRWLIVNLTPPTPPNFGEIDSQARNSRHMTWADGTCYRTKVQILLACIIQQHVLITIPL